MSPNRADQLGWGSYEQLPQGRTLVMGILNVTPDSFSDGGTHDTVDAAIAHGLELAAQGADIVDVGGDSTRPGSVRVSLEEEQHRILRVIRGLSERGIVISVDTLNAETAAAALDAGAHIINDVSGMNVQQDMIELAAQRQVPYILMHSRGTSTTMDALSRYEIVPDEVIAELLALRERLYRAGVKPENLILDPGLGFAKAGSQDWDLLRALPRLLEMGNKVLIAASRKRFLGHLLGDEHGPRPVAERDGATAALSALSAFGGAWAVRVHDVAATADAVATAHAWLGVTPPILDPHEIPHESEN
ncbi:MULTISPECIES: dihydropteroate synthase [Kocuria]|uniref:dihydropteroate synthase n=1 Tax=Kocuria TaxID=57493 RepID=UPI0028F00435|nr:dihydropteroate synthase [Kocuria carniphila]